MTSHLLTEADKQEICSWKYENEYAVYNLPSYEEMSKAKTGFMNPEREQNYRGFFDGDILVGFVNILEEPAEIFIGIGVHPEYCGKHYGRRILDEVCRICKEKFPAKPLYLEVRTWNTRAVKCYQSAGFKIDGEPYEKITGIGKGLFYRMKKD